jgi:two-component sensor histidine kinase
VHKLLERQLHRAFGDAPPDAPGMRAFLAAVDEAYAASDEDRRLIERSLDITSRIMFEKNEALRSARDAAERAKEGAEETSREKGVLLHEIHHRVKNNLQVVVSLLNLQAGSKDQEACRSCFTEATDRIRSMAMVHEMLYEGGDFSALDFSDYAERIARNLLQPDGERCVLSLDLAPLRIGIDQAVPCGLIITEALMNCMKHGRDADGRLRVSMRLADEGLCQVLEIADEGPGFPPSFSSGEGGKFGRILMTSLAEQALGEIRFSNRDGAVLRLVLGKV